MTGPGSVVRAVPPGDGVRPDSRPGLNDRDLRVLRCLAEGNSTAQIAAVLCVSRNTVRTRIRRIQAKLGVADRAATVRAAHHLGVLPVPRPRRPVG
jgi:DNA-binding CsgD family transcriptional regulator